MRYLQRKYPFVQHKINSIILISVAVSFILYISQPFRFDLYQGNKIGASLGFGAITFACLYIFNSIIKKRIAGILKKWTILSEILYILGLILAIAVFNYVYFSVVLLRFSFHVTILFHVIYYTFFIGLIPSVVLILLKYNRYLNSQLNSFIDRKKEDDDLDITITNQLTREKDLKIKLCAFIFAEADKNNVEVYYLHGGEVVHKSVRATITSVREELDHPNLFRCHRSFIVNLSQIESAKGNSNGYSIKLKHYKKELPVSRKYVTDFKSFIY